MFALGGLLFIVFIVTIILSIVKKIKKQNAKPFLIVAIVSIILTFVFTGVSVARTPTTNETKPTEETVSTNTESENTVVEDTEVEEEPIYANAEIVDLMSGDNSKKIGTISVVKANQADCTEEALIDWYFNYVMDNKDCNYHVIVYNDISDKGVYGNALGYENGEGFIQKDIELIKEDGGTYAIGDSAGSTTYDVDYNNKTITARFEMADAATTEEIRDQVDSIIPSEYKNGELYAVDVAGEAGGLMDCNLTLVSESFADADYQSIATDLAAEVKDLDLGIGYFCIAFQSDDLTLNAISNMDDFSTQDPSEISTKEF